MAGVRPTLSFNHHCIDYPTYLVGGFFPLWPSFLRGSPFLAIFIVTYYLADIIITEGKQTGCNLWPILVFSGEQ